MYFDHITSLDQYSMAEALEISGFRGAHCMDHILPCATKSKLSRLLWRMKASLRISVLWRRPAQQSYVVAEVNAISGRGHEALGRHSGPQ